ncbi:MAG TPA: ThuA domain-containing protein [Isosphaeraceae bacterium]|jgi:type 1 glutamine amidotransferase
MCKTLALAALAALTVAGARAADEPGIVFPGGDGPGKGKHVVLIAGDEEYRSEEALPQLAKILADRHGFKCTVLFPVDKDGTINPTVSNIPGLEALRHADLMVIFTRFRHLPEDQMKEIVDYVDSGRPILGMRTATHAFNIKEGQPYAGYSWNSKGWEGGFGRQVLGETWIDHYGRHGKEATRGLIAPGAEGHPILKGIKDGDIFGPTDVYRVRLPLPGDSKPLVLGEVVDGMNPTDPPVKGEKNEVKMPVAWVKAYTSKADKTGRVFNTTMGAATDLTSEGLRRLLVNAAYWAVGLEDQIPEKANVDLVGKYEPTPFGFGGFVKGKRPEDYAGK